mmetsp:Transcript_41211/g.69275  ORF Transcript_41211/g.69275 Transcript_41211/m.69275 type:complete len:574 (+) Transcript_41211:43-1764(+)
MDNSKSKEQEKGMCDCSDVLFDKDKKALGAAAAGAAKLTIIHVTDVYLLDNFPHLRTLVAEKKQANPNTISVLTGDFLAPYLLSSLDHGAAMMAMITGTPIDYLTWGNHEADVGHEHVKRRVMEYHAAGGVWLNSNMQSHETMEYNKDCEVITVKSPDGSQSRKVGLVAVLSDDPSLYKKFASPGAFDGAKIECPWETLRTYQKRLEGEGCDLVIPLQHLYEHEDQRTLEEFDFPVVLSGHDHHKVDKEVNGSRLLKPGSDAHFAVVLDITWESAESAKPSLSWEFVKVKDFAADPDLQKKMEEAYAPLMDLRNTELTPVPERFRPLSSKNSRGQVTTMGQFVCSLVRDAFTSDPQSVDVDVCLIRGGHICGEKDFPPDAFFSFEDLKTVNTDKVAVGVLEIPGSVVVEAVRSTRGSINRLFVQYDDSCAEAEGVVTRLAGADVDPDRLYRVATTPTTIRDIAPFTAYFNAHGGLPGWDDFCPLDSLLMAHFARLVWQAIFNLLDADKSGHIDAAEFAKLDADGDGSISHEELHAMMRSLGYRVADGEVSLVQHIIHAADVNKDGQLTMDDFL